MRYLVTGATGFIGGHVVKQLVEAGHTVAAVARQPAAAKHLIELGVAVYEGDVTDRESLRAPMVAVDGVFHIAGWYRVGARDRRPAQRINVEGTRNVLELMRELDVPKGVYTSTLAVFSDTHGRIVDESYRYNGPHLTEYDRTKWVAHYEIAEPMIRAGLPLVIVQPGVVYGPGDTSLVHDTLVRYLRRRLPVVPAKTAYCWGHVADTARGHILAMEAGKPGESYIIAGQPLSVIDFLATAEKICSVPAPRLQVPPSVLTSLAKLLEPVTRVARLPAFYSPESMRSTAGVTYLGSNEKARRELALQMRSLEEGLPETLDYERSHVGVRPKDA